MYFTLLQEDNTMAEHKVFNKEVTGKENLFPHLGKSSERIEGHTIGKGNHGVFKKT